MFTAKRSKYKLIRPENQPSLEVIDELEKSVGSGSDEDDSLLVQVQEIGDAGGGGGGGGVAVWRRASVDTYYLVIHGLMMGLLVATEIYAQIVIFM